MTGVCVYVPLRHECEHCDERDDLTTCYSCGLDVCRGEHCSGMVRYRLARNRWVRMCRTCIEDRRRWGEITGHRCTADLWAATATIVHHPFEALNGVPVGSAMSILERGRR